MPSLARALLRIAALLLVLQLGASVASAHDCASQADCEETSGYLGGIAIIGGIIAILTGLLGSELGGAIPGVTTGRGGDQRTSPTSPAPAGDGPPERPPRPEPPPRLEPAGVATTEPGPEAPSAGESEPEVPWDDLIAATEPPPAAPEEPDDAGGAGLTLDDLLDDLFGDEPAEPGAGPVPTSGEGGDLTDPLDGEPGIDELVPEEEPVEEPVPMREPGELEEPKPPMLDTVEKITDLAGNVKDAADKLKEDLEDLPIPEEAAEKVNDFLDDVSDKAGKVKDVGEKAGEYIEVLDENLERTDKLGITPESQDFLGWWRITFRAAGELTEKFIDGITAPVTKLLGEKAGDKATDMIHSAVPVKEFGEELSKLPTSAAETVVKGSRRDQIAENVDFVPTSDAGYIELDDLFPGRKWP